MPVQLKTFSFVKADILQGIQIHLVAKVGEPKVYSSPWFGQRGKLIREMKDVSSIDITRVAMGSKIQDQQLSYDGIVLGCGGKSIVDEDWGGYDSGEWSFKNLECKQ